jgi:hypothetical protein
MTVRDDAYRLHYQAQDLEPGETVRANWTASARALGSGGQLTLTNRRVLFEPLRTPKDLLLGPVAKAFGMGDLGKVAGEAITSTKVLEGWAIALTDIVSVDPELDARKLSIRLRSGEAFGVGISAGLYSLRGSGGDRAARDNAVAQLRAAVAAVAAADTSVPPAPQDGATASEPAGGRVEIGTVDDPYQVYFEGPMAGARIGDVTLISMSTTAPQEGSAPPQLAGRWQLVSEGGHPDEFVELEADGTLSGRLWLYGGAPPIAISGRWWFELPSSLVWDFVGALYVPPNGPVIHRFRIPIPLTRVDEDEIVFADDSAFAARMRRIG